MSRRIPDIRQSEASECGLACLSMIASFHGNETDLVTLRTRYDVPLSGLTLTQIADISASLGLSARPLRIELEELPKLQLPALLHWDLDHFVVVTAVRGRRVWINDPRLGRRRFDLDELDRHFTGIALELTPAPDFRRIRSGPGLRIRDLVTSAENLAPSIVSAATLSLFLQLLTIASPLYIQTVIDQAIGQTDLDLVLVLALGFAGVVAFRALAQLLRNESLVYVSNAINFAFSVRLLEHLLRLPLGYFEKRSLGDISSRFGSLGPIRDILSHGLATALVDGVLALLALAIMFAYSGSMTAVVLAAITLYAILRIATVRTLVRLNAEAITAGAAEDSHFLETVRGMRAIKAAARERLRSRRWLNLHTEHMNTRIARDRLANRLGAARTLVFGLENVLIIYLGARAILGSEFTIGMLYAFVAYRTQITDRASALVDQAIELRSLRVHLDRVADIALTAPEARRDSDASSAAAIAGSVTLRHVDFAYGSGAAPVLRDLDLHIEAGECVAITGPSGSGKTTLLKVINGLLVPTGGELLVDELPREQVGELAIRQATAAVYQDDGLFAGTVLENVSFFEGTPDAVRVEHALEDAGMLEDIQRLPLGLYTPVGDMGSVFSSGQMQRLVLARGLYRNPAILLLDEFTAHVDAAMAARLVASLRSRGVTMIVVTHDETVAAATDRRIHLEAPRAPGRVRSVPPQTEGEASRPGGP